MSEWTHPACVVCWADFEFGREPMSSRVPDPRSERLRQSEQCCFCGRDTNFGIFLRRSSCNGKSSYHSSHADGP